MKKAPRILVIRNDKLGDFMLAWPAIAFLKKQYPESELTALVTPYTKDMADICPWIDKTLLDEGNNTRSLSKAIKAYKFDISIALFTETKTALACYLAKIPVRIAPATKLAQIFSNKTLTQRRSQSAKPEYEYNIDLVKNLIIIQGDTPVSIPAPPFLSFDKTKINSIRRQFKRVNRIPDDSLLVIIHPGTGGSAINFSVQQYAALIKTLSENIKANFIITAGPDEEETAQSLSKLITKINHSIYHSINGIVVFSQFIATCDLFISGSTGPLHIAGALNIPTAAFYPARKSATSLRWQTTNMESRRIAFSPDAYSGKHDMKTVDPVTSANSIIKFLSKQNRQSE